IRQLPGVEGGADDEVTLTHRLIVGHALRGIPPDAVDVFKGSAAGRRRAPGCPRRMQRICDSSPPLCAERTDERPAHHDIPLSNSPFMRRPAPADSWAAYSQQRRTEAL